MLKNNYKYRIPILVAFTCFFSISLIYPQNKQDKITTRLSEKISQLEDNETELVWIYFTDKGKSLNKYFEKPSLAVSPKSLARRAKYYKAKPLIDESDIPVNEDYIKQLEKLGIKIKHKTKWFNGVSAFIKKVDLDKIADLKFVKKLDLVAKFKANRKIEKPKKIDNFNNYFKQNKISDQAYTYGYTQDQMSQVNVPSLHNAGFTGTGITIAVMDAGFSNLSHEVFNNINIIATWDFVNNDTTVTNQSDSGDGSHGSYTLALIGGFKDGTYVSPAFNANFILAKTENTDSESPIEEDNWLAAAEWTEALGGVDITSTSLGYRDGFQFGFTDYTSSDMDGNTTIITKAADMLASKGVVVVNSAGNGGIPAPGENTLGAPADGDSVIAVGAVYVKDNNQIPAGTIASFSSR